MEKTEIMEKPGIFTENVEALHLQGVLYMLATLLTYTSDGTMQCQIRGPRLEFKTTLGLVNKSWLLILRISLGSYFYFNFFFAIVRSYIISKVLLC